MINSASVGVCVTLIGFNFSVIKSLIGFNFSVIKSYFLKW